MLHIITTGGTIEGLDCDVKSSESEKEGNLIRDFLDNANVSFQFTTEEAFKKDSRLISLDDRNYLAERIKVKDSKKILITHGTFTMADTANYLGKLKLNKTIVIVGSFISGLSKETDAPFNLGYAIASLEFLSPNVYVAMNGKIFNWDNVIKNVETNKFEYKNEQ